MPKNDDSDNKALEHRPAGTPRPARVPGAFDALQARFAARIDEHILASEEIVLDARLKVAEKQLRTEAAERKVALQRLYHSAGMDVRELAVRHELDVRRAELELSGLDYQIERTKESVRRLSAPASPSLRSSVPPPPLLAPDIPDRQIEAMAFRAAARAAALPPGEETAFWQSLDGELAGLPENVTATIIRRARELRSLAEE